MRSLVQRNLLFPSSTLRLLFFFLLEFPGWERGLVGWGIMGLVVKENKAPLIFVACQETFVQNQMHILYVITWDFNVAFHFHSCSLSWKTVTKVSWQLLFLNFNSIRS